MLTKVRDFIQRGTPYDKKTEEIQACHWSIFTYPGFLLVETIEFSIIHAELLA